MDIHKPEPHFRGTGEQDKVSPYGDFLTPIERRHKPSSSYPYPLTHLQVITPHPCIWCIVVSVYPDGVVLYLYGVDSRISSKDTDLVLNGVVDVMEVRGVIGVRMGLLGTESGVDGDGK
jgi:hypothetical protein